MRNLIVLTVGALLLASCGGGTVTPPTEQPNPPIETPPPTNTNPTPNPPTTPDKPLYIPSAGAAVGTGDGTKEGTIYISPTSEEIELLNFINEVRTTGKVGGVDVTANSCVSGKFTPLSNLTYNGLYSFAARKHAEYTTNSSYEGHYEENSSSPYFYGRTVGNRVVKSYKDNAGIDKYYVGDNITSYGGELIAPSRESAREAVEDWMLSGGHCAAIMNSSIYDIGVGRSYRQTSNSNSDNPRETWVIILSKKS